MVERISTCYVPTSNGYDVLGVGRLIGKIGARRKLHGEAMAVMFTRLLGNRLVIFVWMIWKIEEGKGCRMKEREDKELSIAASSC